MKTTELDEREAKAEKNPNPIMNALLPGELAKKIKNTQAWDTYNLNFKL